MSLGVATIGVAFLALASLIAVANLIGCFRALRRKHLGIDKGYSSIPLLSILFSLVGLAVFRNVIGYWALLPAAIDPGTWSIVILPFYLLWRVIRGQPV